MSRLHPRPPAATAVVVEPRDAADEPGVVDPTEPLAADEVSPVGRRRSNRVPIGIPRAHPDIVEALRLMIGRYELATGAPVPARLAVVSATPGEGTSTVSRALAETLVGEIGVTSCWVDLAGAGASADLAVGIADVLAGRLELDEVIATATAGYGVLAQGDLDDGERHRVLRSPHLGRALGALSDRFDVVVVDTPAVLGGSDVLAVARHVDGFVFVADQRRATRAQIAAALRDLTGVPCVGVVLNRADRRTPRVVRRLLSG